VDSERLVLSLDYVLPGWNWWSDDVMDSYAVQWAVYLCQVCGMPFDYLYSWPPIVEGPYCGALAADLERLTQESLAAVRETTTLRL